jgi:hypothetical protein
MFLYVQTFKNDVRVSISLNPFSYVFSALSYMICFGHKSFSLLGSKIGATVVSLFSFRPACGTVDNVLGSGWLVTDAEVVAYWLNGAIGKGKTTNL